MFDIAGRKKMTCFKNLFFVKHPTVYNIAKITTILGLYAEVGM